MAKNKHKGKEQRLKWIIVGMTVIMSIGVAAVALMPSGPGTISYDKAFALGDGRLLLVGNSGSDTDIRRVHRVGLVGLDGTVDPWVEGEGAVTVVGVTKEHLWLDHRELRVHALRLTDLQRTDATTAAIKQHPALSQRYQVVGVGDGFALLSGADAKRYQLDADGNIERAAKGVKHELRGANLNRPEVAPQSPITFREAQAVAKTNDELVKPFVVGSGTVGVPVAFAEPPGFLARDFAPYHDSTQQRLHRIGLDGKAQWTATAEEVADAMSTPGVSISFLWVGRRDEALWALVEHTEYERTDDGDYETSAQWMVKLDDATGRPVKSHPLTLAPAPT